MRSNDNDPEGLSGPAGERTVPPVSLRSVQPYRSQDEYVVVMKEDLADWFNELYDTSMTADDLFDRLETGILLCRYACTVNDVIKSRDVRSEPVVYRERGVDPESFQARVNVAEFLIWCRRPPLQMPDDVLFETGDLICHRPAERNERQVALCLLEVGRRSAALRLGLPAPQLVRLEAEIDAEILADDDGLTTTTTDCRSGDVDDRDDEEPLSNASQQSAAACKSQLPVRRTGHLRVPTVNVSSSAEGPTGAEGPTESTETIQSESEKRGQGWQRRRYRPVIPVDMMSLDEMVRQILSRCTCPNQYPMVRVSEGKYRVGDNLTLIFVRILRQHVMVRIGGGWNTLQNYLSRCDPCRSQKNFTSAAVLSSPTTTTSSSSQLAISSNGGMREHQQHLSGDRLNSSCSNLPLSSPSSSEVTMTTGTVSGRQQPVTRRPSDLLRTSQALPVCNANYCRSVSSPPTTTDCVDTTTRKTDDVTLYPAAAEGCPGCSDVDCSATCQGSTYPRSTPEVSDRHLAVLSSSSSSPSLAAAASSSSSTPLHTSCSCTRLMASDDALRRSIDSQSPSSRPSRIPVPLRLAAQCPSHSAGLFRGCVVNSPINQQTYSCRHRRCDSGVDLNLSSPDFD